MNFIENEYHPKEIGSFHPEVFSIDDTSDYPEVRQFINNINQAEFRIATTTAIRNGCFVAVIGATKTGKTTLVNELSTGICLTNMQEEIFLRTNSSCDPNRFKPVNILKQIETERGNFEDWRIRTLLYADYLKTIANKAHLHSLKEQNNLAITDRSVLDTLLNYAINTPQDETLRRYLQQFVLDDNIFMPDLFICLKTQDPNIQFSRLRDSLEFDDKNTEVWFTQCERVYYDSLTNFLGNLGYNVLTFDTGELNTQDLVRRVRECLQNFRVNKELI